ncbi:hypothetical protein OXX79_011476 [Metschnikowia pulcherrima]
MTSWAKLIITVIYLGLVSASWSTHYAFDAGLIYVRLKDNGLVALNFSMSGFDGLSGTSLSSMNLKQDQQVAQLAAPPQNSSMFVYSNTLYAFTGATDDSLSEYDKCGEGVFQLLKYETSSESWVHATDNMTFSDVENVSFYRDSTYLTSTTSSDIYIYGGTCGATGEIVSRLLSLDMDTMQISNISTSTKPQGFFGGTSIWAPSPQQSFVIGGRSADGWLNMYQIATWSFQSGWSFQGVDQNGTTVSSRTNPLALPIFSVLADDSVQTFNRNYNPTSVLVIGGDTAGDSDDAWAKLSYADNSWSWQALSPSIETEDILGAAVIFDTLVVVNGSSSSISKRSEGTYSISLYDIKNDFALVEDLKSNTASVRKSDSASGTLSKNTKVLVGTLVPLSALALIFGVVMFWWRKKVVKKDEASVTDPLDYQLGHYRTRSDQHFSLLGSRPLDLYQNGNDTNSTLDVASIDSWVRKRQEYDATRARPLGRNSYLASNETLGSHPEVNDETISSEGADLGEGPITEKNDDTTVSAAISMIQTPSVYASPDGSPKKAALPARLSQLRTFSYTQTPPQSPMLQRKSRLDPGLVLGEGLDLSMGSDTESPDENMDVQVLVSSKRKSVLRVMNPDMEALAQEGMRLRNPSK